MPAPLTVRDAIPHRPPMLLVDEILSLEGGHIEASKTFRPDEFFVQGHFPEHPVVPGVILCESAVQAGAVLVAQGVDSLAGKVPVLTRMNQVRFRRPVHPGDTVVLSVTLQETLADVYFLSAQVKRDGRTVASLEFACTLAEEA